MRRLFPFFLLSTALAAAGCAPMTPSVRLDPEAPPYIERQPGNPPLYLSVQDRRESPELGRLPAPKGRTGAAVTAKRPAEDVLRITLIDALSRAGFLIAVLPDDEFPSLIVNIKTLRFTVKSGAATTRMTVTGEIEAIGKNGPTTRSKTFRVENAKTFGFSPPADGHERVLNAALSELLEALLGDKAFLAFLAEKN